METDKIIAQLDAEIEKLRQARAAITGSGTSTAAPQGQGRIRRSAPAKKKAARRRLSPEARKRIAEAQRKRWAAAKKSSSGPAKKAPATAKKAARKAAGRPAGKKTAKKAAAKKASPAMKQEPEAASAS